LSFMFITGCILLQVANMGPVSRAMSVSVNQAGR